MVRIRYQKLKRDAPGTDVDVFGDNYGGGTANFVTLDDCAEADCTSGASLHRRAIMAIAFEHAAQATAGSSGTRAPSARCALVPALTLRCWPVAQGRSHLRQ